MINHALAATALLDQVESSDYGRCYQVLLDLAEIATECPSKLSNLTTSQLKSLLSTQGTVKPLTNLVLILHRDRSIKIIPKVLSAFERQLRRLGIPIIKIDYAKTQVDETEIKKQFGSNSIIISRLDSNLLAGVRLTVSDQTYENSLRQQLRQISLALNTSE
ncbi:MAG: F0F1 ATP synthase subunit delta [Patescibacteria group bacterium]|jgi:F0F1-type ATP synthase delta subunit